MTFGVRAGLRDSLKLYLCKAYNLHHFIKQIIIHKYIKSFFKFIYALIIMANISAQNGSNFKDTS